MSTKHNFLDTSYVPKSGSRCCFIQTTKIQKLLMIETFQGSSYTPDLLGSHHLAHACAVGPACYGSNTHVCRVAVIYIPYSPCPTSQPKNIDPSQMTTHSSDMSRCVKFLTCPRSTFLKFCWYEALLILCRNVRCAKNDPREPPTSSTWCKRTSASRRRHRQVRGGYDEKRSVS